MERVTTFKKSNEAFWWSLFSAGGVMSALFLPVMVILCGLVLPWQSGVHDRRAAYEHIHGLVSWWPVRLVLAGVIALSFFHVAHRIRHVLIDLGWRHQTAPLSLIFGAVLYHSFTWFNLTPKIMPIYVAEEKVPDFWAAILMGYLPWAAVTAVVMWGALRWTG